MTDSTLKNSYFKVHALYFFESFFDQDTVIVSCMTRLQGHKLADVHLFKKKDFAAISF